MRAGRSIGYSLHMGRFSYWMNVSLDGFIESHAGEDGDGAWMRIDDEVHREFNARARELDAMINGRVVYEIMEGAWPAFAVDETVSPVMREYGQIWVEARKYLVSNTRTSADYGTTIISGDDVITQLAELREAAAGTIGVGGATLATQLLEAELLDELILFVHPALLGSGRPLFDRLARPLHLEPIEERAVGNGVFLHRYAVLHGG